MLKDERALQRKVMEYLNPLGQFENRSPGPFGRIGVPDITGCYLGRAVAIELKHPREHGPTASDTRWPAQQRFLQLCVKNGGFGIATNDYDYVIACIRAIKYTTLDYFEISIAPAAYREYWA
jgi:hypothetical protein